MADGLTRYRVLHDETSEPERRWVLIDDAYGLVLAYFSTRVRAEKAASRLEGNVAC